MLGNNSNDSDFNVLVKSHVFVDKTLLIKTAIYDNQSVNVITAPSRFGKSAMISMMKHFLECQVDKDGNEIKDKNLHLFSGLKITKTDKAHEIMQYFGKYPVVHLDLMDEGDDASLENAVDVVRTAIHKEYIRHRYMLKNTELLEKYADCGYKDILQEWTHDKRYENIPKKRVRKGLTKLVEMLQIHHNIKCWVLIDEYDSLVNKALGEMEFTELKKMTKWVIGTVARPFKGTCAKYVAGGIITGVSYLFGYGLSRTLNNIPPRRFPKVHDYTEFLALNEEEVRTLFKAHRMEKFLAEALTRYNGYVGKNNVALYNPYSVYRCIHNKENCLRLDKIDDHWKANDIVKGITTAFKIKAVRAKIYELLDGGRVCVEMTDFLLKEDLKQLNTFMSDDGQFEDIKEKIVFGFLAEQGCLVCHEAMSDEFPVWIPNQQIKTAFLKELATHFLSFHSLETKACQGDLINMLCNVTEVEDTVHTYVLKFLKSFNKLLRTMFGHVKTFKEIHLQTALAVACAIEHWKLDVASNIDIVNDEGNQTYGVSDIWITFANLKVCALGELKNNQGVEKATDQITKKQYMKLVKQSEVWKKGITHCFVFGLSCTGTARTLETERSVTLDMLYDVREIPEELKYCDNPELLNGLHEHDKVRVGNVIYNFLTTEANRMKLARLPFIWKTIKIE